MYKYFVTIAAAISLLILTTSCEEKSTSPGENELGGDTDLELTEVGNEFGISMKMEGDNEGVFSQIKDSVFITKNNNGVVTVSAKFNFDEETYRKIDTLLDLHTISEDIKFPVYDAYLERFGATLDTSDRENITIDAEIKLKVTSEGIQDYNHSNGNESKPFTIIKYNAGVGEKYEFTRDDGSKIVRNVTYKSTEDEYELGFIKIKVTKTEEQSDDPLVDKIIYYTNHKFGLVGVQIDLTSGKTIMSKVLPWDVLID